MAFNLVLGNSGSSFNIVLVDSGASVVPTLTTEAISGIAEENATANGIITNTGGENCTNRGFVYDTQSRSLPGNIAPGSSGYANYIIESGSFIAESFTGSLINLNPYQPYYVRAWAQNSAGYSYGDEETFTTLNWAVRLKGSDNIPAGGTTSTTRQLTIPSGKAAGDFEVGKITDDTNPLASFDPGTSKFSEWEVCIEIINSLVGNNDEIEFRITNSGTVIDSYTLTPKWIIEKPGGVTKFTHGGMTGGMWDMTGGMK